MLYGDCEGFIISFFNNSSTCLVISSLWTGGNLYCLEKIGASSTVGIECRNTLVASSSSPGIWNLSALFSINYSTRSYRESSVLKKLSNILLDKSSLFVCLKLCKFSKSSKLTIGTDNDIGISFVFANFK